MKKADRKLTAGDKLRRCELALYLVLLYAVHCCIYLNGDDFMYSVFGRQGIFENAWSYYHTDNGRFIINALTSALLLGGRYIYIALNPLLIMLFLWLLAKNVQVITGRGDEADILRQVLTGGVLFACLDVMCLRETVFWITGMMNYLFPATVFLFGLLLFWYALAGRISGWQWVPYCAVCLVAAFTVEQYSLMFVGVMTLTLVSDIFKKKKREFPVYLGYVLALFGVLVLFSAPGNFARADNFDYIANFKYNFANLFRQNTFTDVPLPFLLMLSLCGAAFEYKLKKSRRALLWFSVPVILMAVGAIPALNKNKLWLTAVVIYTVQMLRLFAFRRYAYKARLLMLAFVGLGSQLMLLVSPIWGWRCMLSIFVVHMLLLFCCLGELDEKTRLFILCSGITASIHPLFTVAYWASTLILGLMKKEAFSALFSGVILRLSVTAALLVLLFGYAGNVEIHTQNLESTKNPENGVITLRQLPDDTYSWYGIPFDKPHEKYYRILHGIPDDVEINYKKFSG